jgi:hypothetical protein
VHDEECTFRRLVEFALNIASVWRAAGKAQTGGPVGPGHRAQIQYKTALVWR